MGTLEDAADKVGATPAAIESLISDYKLSKDDAAFLRNLAREHGEWKKAARAYRDEMLRQGAIERFKQETIRKLTQEESDLVNMVATARAETVELLKEKNELEAKLKKGKKR